MAETTVRLGDLQIRLVLDNVAAKKGVKETQQDLEAFEKRVSAVTRNVTTRLIGMVTAFVGVSSAVAAFKSAINVTTELDNLSKMTGVSIQRLGELRGIALLVGTDFEVLSRAMSTFGGRMAQQLQEPASQASQALRALGISNAEVRRGMENLDQFLPILAEKLGQFRDGMAKSAITSAIFGEELGPRMLPILSLNRDGLERLRQTLGKTLTPEDAAKVREYREALGKLQLTFEELAQEIVRTVGPGLTAVFAAIRDGIREINAWRQAQGQANSAVRDAAQAHDYARERLDFLKNSQAEFNERVAGGRVSAEAAARGQANLTQQIREQEEIVRKAAAAFAQLMQAQGVGPFQTTTTQDNRPQAPGLDKEATERAQFALDQLMERLSGSRTILDEMNFAWADHADRVAMAVEKINAVHEAGFRRERAIAQMKQQLARVEQDTILATAAMAAQTITMLWSKSKGIAIASAIINTAVGVTRALSASNPPWNFIQAALIAAQGAAQIATIRATNQDGSGGAPSLSGGAAAPAEAQGAPMGRSVNITGVDPAHIFTGTQMEKLIENIGQEVRDGATLISSGVRPT